MRLLRYASSLGDKLCVGVYADKLSDNTVFVDERTRLQNVASVKFVDEAVLITGPLEEFLLQLKPDIVAKGAEFQDLHNVESKIVEQYGGKLIFNSGESSQESFSRFDRPFDEDSAQNFDFQPKFLERHGIKIEDLTTVLRNISKLSVCVIGDLIVDEYVQCDAVGMSREDPTIVVSPLEHKKFVGGAGIVAAHSSNFCKEVDYISVAGEDDAAEFSQKTLAHYNVNTFLFKDSVRKTTLKQRFRAQNKTLLRINHIKGGNIPIETQQLIVEKIQKKSKHYDLVIFSDFSYGCLPDNLISTITQICQKNNIIMAADSQSSSQIGDICRFAKMKLITPTEHEARLGLKNNKSGLPVLAKMLQTSIEADCLFLKLGSDGVYVQELLPSGSIVSDRIRAFNSNPTDVAGAGDSMLVLGSLALASGASIWEAAYLGSLGAAIQVGQLGNTPISTKKLKKLLSQHLKH